MSKSLEERVRRLEDLEEIRQLFVDYGRYLDAGNVDAYAELFAEEGELLLGPIGRAQGAEEIRALMTRVLAGVTGNSYHLIANPTVVFDGLDDASSEVSWAVVARDAAGAPDLTMLGRHVVYLIYGVLLHALTHREGHIDLPSNFPTGS